MSLGSSWGFKNPVMSLLHVGTSSGKCEGILRGLQQKNYGVIGLLVVRRVRSGCRPPAPGCWECRVSNGRTGEFRRRTGTLADEASLNRLISTRLLLPHITGDLIHARLVTFPLLLESSNSDKEPTKTAAPGAWRRLCLRTRREWDCEYIDSPEVLQRNDSQVTCESRDPQRHDQSSKVL